MRRINVVGTTGSGKSHFSRDLAQRLDVEYIQMDQLHWKPAWIESSTEELLTKLASRVSADAWVLDGNYSKTAAIKWQDADTIIWLDFSFFRTFYQLLCRTIRRVTTREELWPGTGNVETWHGTFLSSDSILVWFLLTYSRNRRVFHALQHSSTLEHIQFVRLRSPAEVSRFLEGVSAGDLANKVKNH